MQKSALGKGLGALIPVSTEEGITEIDISSIQPSEYQPRKRFDDLQGLASSIKSKGILQPVIVRRSEDGSYRLVTGERRWRAAKMVGLKEIPAIVKDVAESERLELALIENLQREDLNPLETAEACHRLIKDFHLTQEELSKHIGKERSSIANYLRLLKLPSQIKQWIAGGDLSMGHAKAILSLDRALDQISLGRKIINKGLSVREAEVLASRVVRHKPPSIKRKDPQISNLEDALKRFLGTKVRIYEGEKGGRVEIEYYSKNDLIRIIEIFQKGGLDV